MKTQSNLRKNLIDNSSETQAKIKFICVVEEDLDFEYLQPAGDHHDSASNECSDQSNSIKRYKYLCYLRSMDDMV